MRRLPGGPKANSVAAPSLLVSHSAALFAFTVWIECRSRSQRTLTLPAAETICRIEWTSSTDVTWVTSVRPVKAVVSACVAVLCVRSETRSVRSASGLPVWLRSKTSRFATRRVAAGAAGSSVRSPARLPVTLTRAVPPAVAVSRIPHAYGTVKTEYDAAGRRRRSTATRSAW